MSNIVTEFNGLIGVRVTNLDRVFRSFFVVRVMLILAKSVPSLIHLCVAFEHVRIYPALSLVKRCSMFVHDHLCVDDCSKTDSVVIDCVLKANPSSKPCWYDCSRRRMKYVSLQRGTSGVGEASSSLPLVDGFTNVP